MIMSLNQQTMSLRATLLGLAILLLWGEMRHVEAGCQRFGHSCFGAHGKRAEIPNGMELSESLAYNNNQPIRASDLDSSVLNNNRMSPYLIDWLMSMHRGELRQPLALQIPRQEELSLSDRRRK